MCVVALAALAGTVARGTPAWAWDGEGWDDAGRDEAETNAGWRPAEAAMRSTEGRAADAETRRALDELERGPDLRTTQRMAMSWLLIDRPLASVERSRGSHLLPDRVEVSGAWVRGGLLRDDVTVTEDYDDMGRLDDTRLRLYGREDLSTRFDVRVGVRWDLGGLVWSGDELAIEAAERRVAEQRRAVMQSVADAWFLRRRTLALLLVDPPSDPVRRLERELAVDEATARLDALTGGWYSQQLAADLRSRSTPGRGTPR